MRRPWFLLGVLLTGLVSVPLSAQQAPPEPQAKLTQQQKSSYYTQVEYQRCRSDVIELLVKSEAIEQQVRDLEEQNQKLTEALQAVRSQDRAKTTNEPGAPAGVAAPAGAAVGREHHD